MTSHHTLIEGASALSPVRAQQLLSRLQAKHDTVSSVSAQYLYLVVWPEEPDASQKDRLQGLLTQGSPVAQVIQPYAGAWWVTPRLGTLSPWASKATDIARNCGLPVSRIERALEYRVGIKGWRTTTLDPASWQIGRAHV